MTTFNEAEAQTIARIVEQTAKLAAELLAFDPGDERRAAILAARDHIAEGNPYGPCVESFVGCGCEKDFLDMQLRILEALAGGSSE